MSVLDAISVAEICARGTITEADVSALRRAFYDDGKIDATEAAALCALNRTCTAQDASWADCFVEMLTDYVVNQDKPHGYVTAENAEWLAVQITTDGRINSKTELELLVNVLDKARWSPQSLVAFALDQVKTAVIEGTGPLRANGAVEACVINEAEVELLKRVLYAFGGDSNIAVTRPEAQILFDIDAATAGNANAESWPDLFVKAIANSVMAASGYAAPSREQALARETWLEKRNDLSPSALAQKALNAGLSGILSAYREQSSIERAIAALERQKVEIITADEVIVADAEWLAGRIAADGKTSPNEQQLLAFLATNNQKMTPELDRLLMHVKSAA
jgi:hypothetical protein